jgi:hypothetical protein
MLEWSSWLQMLPIKIVCSATNFLVISGLNSVLDHDDAVADINATLGGNLQIALYDITQIRIAIKLRSCFVLERL